MCAKLARDLLEYDPDADLGQGPLQSSSERDCPRFPNAKMLEIITNTAHSPADGWNLLHAVATCAVAERERRDDADDDDGLDDGGFDYSKLGIGSVKAVSGTSASFGIVHGGSKCLYAMRWHAIR